MTTKNQEIERLRGVAIVLTLLCHLPWPSIAPTSSTLLRGSIAGVELFFVISGFVVSLHFIEAVRRVGVGKGAMVAAFYVRRFYRLVPIAVLGMILTGVWAVVLGVNSSDYSFAKNIARETIALLSGFQNYALSSGITIHLGHYWSLAVEFQFYLVLPLALALIPSFRGRVLGVLLVIGTTAFVLRPLTFLLRADGQHGYLGVRSPTHMNLDFLGAGVLLALLYCEGYRFRGLRRLPGVTLLPCLLFFTLAVFPNLVWLPNEPQRMSIGASFAILLSSAMLVAFASAQENTVFAWSGVRQVLEYLGDRSYALYVLHPICFVVSGYRLEKYGGWLHGVGALLVAVCVAEIAVRFLERPLRAYGVRISRRFDAPVAPVVAIAEAKHSRRV